MRPCMGRRCVKGFVSCNRCKGVGNLPRTNVSMGPSGGSFSVTKELCPDCDGRARWTCPQCQGKGNNPCQACANKLKTNDALASDVKQKLDYAVQILNLPPDSSWARELIVQDRSPFRSSTAMTLDAKTQVKRRYFRRSGGWTDRP